MDLPLYALPRSLQPNPVLIILSGGGMPMSSNRTKWPVGGGAVGLQPGWFQGHSNALFYINMGEGTVPLNYSLPMQTVFGITGPTNDLYNGSICIPQVPLPVNYTAVVGANATIQVIELAQHGASLFSVSSYHSSVPIKEATEKTPRTNSLPAVRGHHLRRTGRSRTSHAGQLLQFFRHLLPRHLLHQSELRGVGVLAGNE